MDISFYDRCIEENQYGILDNWDYELNKCSPHDVPQKTRRKFYFKCARGLHDSTEYSLIGFYSRDKLSKKFLCAKCHSFAQWGEDTLGKSFLDDYWDYAKNTLDPWVIPSQCNKKVWIKCNVCEYHGSYSMTCTNFFHGCRCGYCGSKTMHPTDSLAAKYPESIQYWSQLNNASPYSYAPTSNKKAWWVCPDHLHSDYLRTISDSSTLYNFRCPKCSSDKTVSIYQKEVDKFLNTLGYTILHEQKCTLYPRYINGYRLRYDNQILELNCILEVHGEQHYPEGLHFFYRYPENERINMLHELQKRDKFKKEYAISHGYHYLEIPYTTIQDGTYIDIIKNTIALIESSAA